MEVPPRRPQPNDADAWFESFFDGDEIRFGGSIAFEVDEHHVRTLAVRTLRDAGQPDNPSGSPEPLDLDAQWHVLQVTVRANSPGIAGGSLGARDTYLRSLRDLIDALIAHLSE